MTTLYRSESSNPKWNAQRNLAGRTHYVDDDTLRYHKARVLSSRTTDGGLLFALVESVATVYDGSKRGYRYVIFDLFGHIVGKRADLENCYRSSAAAEKAMWTELNSLDAKAITREGMARERRHMEQDYELLAKEIDKVTA